MLVVLVQVDKHCHCIVISSNACQAICLYICMTMFRKTFTGIMILDLRHCDADVLDLKL